MIDLTHTKVEEFIMTVQTPYRYDVVGSFLRPEKLKQARKDYESKKISREELTQIEDECITDLVQKEKAAGLHVITDGEFRRATWHLDFMWGFDGVSHTPTKTGLPFHGEAAMIDDTYITGKVGVNCSWGMLVDEKAPLFFQTDQEGLLKVQELFLRINNLAIEGKPEDLTINTHVCRGNFHSTYASSGAYDAVAKTLFAKENVHAYFLEFDDARSGGFEPLKEVTPDKKVVLGLVTTKLAKLEDKEIVIARIKEASQYVPLENLCLSPQCGFASCEIGNKLTEEQQWAKVKLVKEIAEEVWG